MSHALTDRLWKRILWIAGLALLAYLPAALRLTYYRDDWYYAYDAMIGPAGVFRYMFAEDRPARGPFFELYHALFGMAPTPYHLAMLWWRAAGGAAVAWLLHLLWPRRTSAGLMGGALFALYPGFTWWVQGIEYQPMVASAALSILSLCLTVLALRLQRPWARLASAAGAILTGWSYLALVEYAAGMELFRAAIIYFALGDTRLRNFRLRAKAALRAWLPYLIIPAGFAIWRFGVFTSARKATDLGAQLAGFFADPVSAGLHWLMSLLLSILNVTLAAWVQPLQDSFFALRLREQVPALGFALAAGLIVWLLLRRADIDLVRKTQGADDGWQPGALWLGLAALILGILPVVAANRQVTFPSFSHYALPASLGVALFVVAIVDMLSSRPARVAAYVALTILSVLTLQALGAAALREERTIASFWHQMAWRASSVEPGTTLLVIYPDVEFGTDSDVVWGPANFVYHPEPQSELPIRLAISALSPDDNALGNLYLQAGSQESTYRAHSMTTDRSRVLIAVQSAPDSCLRVIAGRSDPFSIADDPQVYRLAPFSRVGLISASGPAPELPERLFGPEPEHGWCYYFQMASRAALAEDWQKVASLYDEVGRLGLNPNDQIEWIPFLMAEARLGDQRSVKDMATRINTEPYYRQQACAYLILETPLSQEMRAAANELFRCGAVQ